MSYSFDYEEAAKEIISADLAGCLSALANGGLAPAYNISPYPSSVPEEEGGSRVIDSAPERRYWIESDSDVDDYMTTITSFDESSEILPILSSNDVYCNVQSATTNSPTPSLTPHIPLIILSSSSSSSSTTPPPSPSLLPHCPPISNSTLLWVTNTPSPPPPPIYPPIYSPISPDFEERMVDEGMLQEEQTPPPQALLPDIEAPDIPEDPDIPILQEYVAENLLAVRRLIENITYQHLSTLSYLKEKEEELISLLALNEKKS